MRQPIHASFNDHWKKIPGPLNTPCWIWCRAISSNGYGNLWDGKTMVLAHRFSYQRNNLGSITGKYVCHECDVPLCVNPSHLFLSNAVGNNKDCSNKGRKPAGCKNSMSSLANIQISEIRASSKAQSVLAVEYGVTQGTISRIKNGVTYK